MRTPSWMMHVYYSQGYIVTDIAVEPVVYITRSLVLTELLARTVTG